MNADLVRLADDALWFVAAAALMVLGMWLLFLALGLYAWALTKLVRQMGATAAFIDFCHQRRNREARWNRMINWSIERWRGTDEQR